MTSQSNRHTRAAPLPALRGLAGTAALGLLLFAGAAQAEPVAMVLDSTDAATLPAFTELSEGDVLTLGSNDHIDLLDYRTCREVRYTAGTLTITALGIDADGSAETELRPGNCVNAQAADDTSAAAKGLTVTLRGFVPENKVAATLMLRFAEGVQKQYDSVFVSFHGGPPLRFKMQERLTTEMPPREDDNEPVAVEVFLQGKSPDFGVEARRFLIDPAQGGRKTAVVLVQ